MAIETLKLPNAKQKTEARPEVCPYCQGETFQRRGQGRKPVKDTRAKNVKVCGEVGEAKPVEIGGSAGGGWGHLAFL